MFSGLSSLIPSSLKIPSLSAPPPAERAVNLSPVEVHDVETLQEKPARTLKHLLKLNHANFSILYNGLMFYNHVPHLLSTGYLLGGDAEHLHRLYESESKELKQWVDSPGEISEDDWRTYLGKREYQRAFVDFFEDELAQNGYDWKKVVEQFLCSGNKPLINSLVAGFGHPLIHMGYAFEMSSREVAMEALAMISTCYSDVHKYLDDPSYLQAPASSQTTSTFEILNRIRHDKRFDGIFEQLDVTNFDTLLKNHEAPFIEHWSSWNISNATEQFETIQRLATTLLVNSSKPHDFFFDHLLTTTHALRVLFTFIPAKHHISLLRQWWLLAVGVYITQSRPAISEDSVKEIQNHDLDGRDWKWVNRHALSDKLAVSPHYIKPIRTMREAAKTWGDNDQFYLRAALKFIDEFKGFGGL